MGNLSSLRKDSRVGAKAPPSPVEKVLVRDRLVYLKRDDQLRVAGPRLSGNKARKMLSLALLSDEDFPECIVSYGGPQSNAMLALAAIVHFRNISNKDRVADVDDSKEPNSAEDTDDASLRWQDQPRKKHRFVYYTKRLPRFLRNQPNGNLFRAQSLGIELEELSPVEYNRLFGGDWAGSAYPPSGIVPPVPSKSLYVPQGGACEVALLGVEGLAEEIVDYWTENGGGRPLSVLVPGGTCSTALFLHCAVQDLLRTRFSSLDVQVIVIPCVGDEGYALRQMMSLNTLLERPVRDVPRILPPCPPKHPTSKAQDCEDKRYFTFGEPDREVLDAWREMRDDHDVVLDLLYGAPSWAVLLRHLSDATAEVGSFPTSDSPIASRALMYVHSGGLEGINSQLLRYKHKNLVDVDQIQLPGRSTASAEPAELVVCRPESVS
jgi:1-aminocyclopropane-1-carboxylate deaminase/D-cysteine desulfhydrase-like pyridoxal-dependent ACC family enzyme